MFKSLSSIRFVLWFLGITEPGRYSGFRHVVYRLSTGILSVVFFVYAGLFTPSAYISRFDAGLFAQYASIMFYGSMTIIEFAYLLIRQKKLLGMLEHMEKKFLYFGSHGITFKEDCRLKEVSLIRSIVLLQSPTFIVILVFIFFESSEDDAKWNIHLGKKYPERTIPYMVWIPYDETISPYYEIALITVYCCLLMCALIMHILCTLTPVVIIHICGQFKMISFTLENLIDPNEEFDDKKNGTVVENSLVDAIIAHQSILRFSRDVICFFRPLILFKIIFYFGILSVLLFAVSTMPFGSKVYFQSLFCCCGFTFELFLLCFYGEYVTAESQKVGRAAYHSLWYKCPKRIKNALQFIILRSQVPLQFDVQSNFIIACLKTYIQVFQASFSYFTVLRNIHNDVE